MQAGSFRLSPDTDGWKYEQSAYWTADVAHLRASSMMGKADFTLEQATETQRWSRGIALLFL